MYPGYCIYIYPFREDYSENGLPAHPCLKLVGNSEQVLSKHTSRRLLTYEKINEPEEVPHEICDNNIVDFRAKFYETREESRQERRIKKAALKEKGRLEAEKRRNQNKTSDC